MNKAVGATLAVHLDKAALQEKIAALQEKKEWHEELLAQLDKEQKQIPEHLPLAHVRPKLESRFMGQPPST